MVNRQLQPFRLPGDNQHIAIIGQNGTGKTQAGIWQLSLRSYDRMPWIILNFKNEELINSIEDAQPIDLDKPPKKKGLYVVNPRDGDEEALERFMKQIHTRAIDDGIGTGIFIDEAYMLDKNSDAFKLIWTQGRSLNLPVISLTQRPVLVSRFMFSEATFHQIFFLVDRRDRKTVEEWIPLDFDQYFSRDGNSENDLADFWSIYYDVRSRRIFVLRPVPEQDVILGTFHSRLAPRKVFI